MAKGHLSKNKQTPTSKWAVYVIVLPLLQLVVGAVIMLLPAVKSKPPLLTLFGGAVLSLWAVALLAGTVCAFHSPTPPPVTENCKWWVGTALGGVTIFSVVGVSLHYTNQIPNTEAFVAAQGLLALIALPLSWRARA